MGSRADSPQTTYRLEHYMWKRWFLLALVAMVALATYLLFRDTLTLENLAAQENALRTYRDAHPVLVYVLAFLVYVAVTALGLPFAGVMSLVYGWYFGFIPGVILVSIASASGATLSFLLSRYLFRDFIKKQLGARLELFDRAVKEEGTFFLFTLRLIPAVPFFIINLVMGLTPMRVLTFWWVSQIGMLPGTLVYLWAGSSVSLATLAEEGPQGLWPLLIAFAVLGAFPLLVRLLFRRIFPTKTRMAELASRESTPPQPK